MSNRNFDSRVIIQRLQQQNYARNLYKNNVNGQGLINNPQNSDGNSSRLTTFVPGAQTEYFRGLIGAGETVSLGGTFGISSIPISTVTPAPPVINLVTPAPPVINSVTPGSGNGELIVDFTPSTFNGGSPIITYWYTVGQVYVSIGIPLTNTFTITTTDGTTPLSNGTEYTVKMGAENIKGQSSDSNSLSATTNIVQPATQQLLINPEFTDIVSNGANGWTSTRGWDAWQYAAGNKPTAIVSMPIRAGVYPISTSTGFIIFTYVQATISQIVSITSLSGYNTITGVLNIVNVSNNATDKFTFQIQYKDNTGTVIYTSTTGNINAPSTWTDFTLTLTRNSFPNFDLIKSITVSINAVDSGFWAGQYGPAMDYCRLTIS